MNESLNQRYKNPVLLLILFSTLLRCILASNIEFGNDEVYYWTYALHLQMSYFDHPPLIAFFIRLFTFNLNLNNELFVRLTSIIGAAVNTWMLYKILSRIKNETAGWYAALLYNGCIYSTFICGFLIIPDSPQIVFWLWSVYLLIRIFILKEDETKNIILFGIAAGITTMCKVHGIYLWFAAGLFILCFNRKMLLNPYVYLAGLTTLIIISPIFIWNYNNSFITYSYQGGRVAINNGIQFSSFSTEVLGEILYCNPIIFVFITITIIASVRKRLFKSHKQLFWLLIFLSVPLILVLCSISLFRDTLPHWSGPAYLSLLIFTAFFAGECYNKKLVRRFLVSANSLVLISILAAWIMINYLPANLGKKDPGHLGEGDFTMDIYGWNSFKNDFNKLHIKDINDSSMNADAVIISDKWFPASHIDYYVARPLQMKLYAFGPLYDIHNFAWLNNLNGNLKKGDDAYYISPSNYSSSPDTTLKKLFSCTEPPTVLHEYRSHIAVRNFYIYRLKQFK